MVSRRMPGWDWVQTWSARALEPIASRPLGRPFDPQSGRLGWLQRWYAAQPTPRVVIGVLEWREPLDRSALETALRALCARHEAALGVCVARSPERLEFKPLTAAGPLPWVESSSEWWVLAGELAHVHFAVGAPLFRVAVDAEQRRVILALDHLIVDGISVAVLGSELARLLAGEPLPPAADPQPTWPLDARLDVRPSLRDILRRLRAGNEYLAAPQSAASPLTAAGTLRTVVLPFLLEAGVVEALRVRAAERGVTSHSALAGASLPAALAALAHARARLRLATPVSLREQCRPVPTGLGVYVGGVDSDLDVSRGDDPWRLAARYQLDLREQRPQAHLTVGMLALAGDLNALARKYERERTGRTATIEVSNIGRVRDLPSGAALWVTQGAHYHGPLFVLTATHGDNDCALRVCLSYPDPLIDEARARCFVDALARQLHAMAGEDSAGFAHRGAGAHQGQ